MLQMHSGRSVTTSAVELPELCVLRRFLVASFGVAADPVSSLVTSGRLEDVRSVELARGLVVAEVTWTTDRARYVLCVSGSTAKKVVQALRPASAGA